MAILPRQPGDPLGIEDIVFIISILAGIAMLVFIVIPAINVLFTPGPDVIIKFYANGTAMLGNGTLINLSCIRVVY